MSDKPIIWKSVITILTEFDPYGVSLEDLGYEAERGDGYCLSKVSQPATPDEIAQTGDFFFPDNSEEDAEPDWVDRHSVNCAICDILFDEREAVGRLDDEGEVCTNCREAIIQCPMCAGEGIHLDLSCFRCKGTGWTRPYPTDLTNCHNTL